MSDERQTAFADALSGAAEALADLLMDVATDAYAKGSAAAIVEGINTMREDEACSDDDAKSATLQFINGTKGRLEARTEETILTLNDTCREALARATTTKEDDR